MRKCVYVAGSMLYNCTISMIRYNIEHKHSQDMYHSDGRPLH